ncbi:pantetheine-phosphate adenylyltransferase [Candidatus Microgenomates bacterium]|nr:pantetheine-phosphate adenylyltransferase [Candidatus Microgenomates bacterium]
MYKTIAIAGTFDLLHKGHRYFIQQAFSISEKVIIGLMSDTYVEKKFKIQTSNIKSNLKIQNFEIRKLELEKYLLAEGYSDRAEIVKIDDIYGPAITDNRIEALVVTKETYFGARKVNQKRKELGLSPLKINIVPFVKAQDGRRIASTRIRMGEIDREGNKYLNSKLSRQSGIHDAVIPNKSETASGQISEEVRQELKKPQGRLMKGDDNNHKKIVEELKRAIGTIRPAIISTVGDEVTKLCNEVGIPINLAIFDFKVKRKKIYNSILDLSFPSLQDVVKVRNPSGCITKTLIAAVSHGYKQIIQDGKTRIIKVIGEDDLAGVPAILLAPLGSLVIYGQPNTGIVVVEVTEEKKKELFDIIIL